MFRTHRFLFTILLLFILLRLPSLFEPYWYGDEGIYQTVGMAMREGRMLYSEIWDNKPPFLFLLYALVWGNQFWMRLLSLITGCASVVVFSSLSRNVFPSLRSSLIAMTAFALLLGLPLHEGNIANAENFMLLPTVLGIWLLFHRSFFRDKRIPVLCGLLLSVAFLIKVVALFDLLAVVVFLLFQKKVRRVLLVMGGFIVLPLLTGVYFYSHGILPIMIRSVFTDGVEYIQYNNALFIPHGLLMVKTGLLFVGIGWVYFRRKRLSSIRVFLLLWLVCSLYSVYFSGRGYVHYLLLLLPAYALLAGQAVEEKKRYFFSLAIWAGITLLTMGTFNIYGNTVWYYANAIAYVANLKSETQYHAFFDPITVRNYRIAAFINRNLAKEDRIFIWGNSAQIYYMTGKLPPGRFTVAYHILGNEEATRETQEAFRTVKPKLLVILTGQEQYPYGYEGYTFKTIIDGGELYKRIDDIDRMDRAE